MPDTPPPAVAPIPAPSPAPVPWHTGLDAEVLGHIQNKGWSLDDPKLVVSEATKAYKSAEQKLGAPPGDLLRIAKPADEANWRAMRQKLGAPDKPEGYDFFSTVKRADGTELEPAFVDAMRTTFAKAYLPKEDAAEITKAVVKYQADREASDFAARTAKVAVNKANLEKKWGPEGGQQWLINMQHARMAAQRAGASPEIIANLENLVGYDGLLEFLRPFGLTAGVEDKYVEGGARVNPATSQAAQDRINTLMSDRDGWQKRFSAGGKAEKLEFDQLMEQVTGVDQAKELAQLGRAR